MTEVCTRTDAAPTRTTPVTRLILILVAGAIGAGLAVALWIAGHVHPDPVLHDFALFVHLSSLVVGFGAVLAVDWVALLWTVRRRHLYDVLRMAENAQVPIWAGYAGLVGSGILLEPDLGSLITQIKLGLVLVIGWNGLFATGLHGHLSHGASDPPRKLVVVSACAASVSQLGWWGAMVIGFVNGR